MNVNSVPSQMDELTRMDASATRTANTNGTSRDLGATYGASGIPMNAVIRFGAADRADANETYTFTVQESADNSAWTTITVGVAVTGAAGAVAIPAVINGRYVRIVLTVGGTTPSITYESWLTPLGFAS